MHSTQDFVRPDGSAIVVTESMLRMVERIMLGSAWHTEHFRPRKSGTLKLIGVDDSPNVVCDLGANDLLDKYFAGSAYTAAFFVGLISSVSWSAVAAANTMASHAGWLEAAGTNVPNYSGGTRPALTMASAASSRSKVASAASSFTFSSAGTIKGLFTTTNSTKDGTTGILYNAVLFTGGDRVVAISDVVNVTPTFTA
jgi:hypothetical protein